MSADLPTSPRFVIADPWADLAARTPARLALGRAGAALPSREVLRLALAHAQARDAVHAAPEFDQIAEALQAAGRTTLCVESAAPDRATYLRRPDLGRRLSARSREALSGAETSAESDGVVVIADGLSARAVNDHALAVLMPLADALADAGLTLAPVVLAREARVALGDEIGARLRARLCIMLVGERPGLSAADSLGAYLTFGPGPGRSDADRNCVSNIRPGGLAPAQAAARIAWLVDAALRRGLTGVALKDESPSGLTGAGSPERLAAAEEAENGARSPP